MNVYDATKLERLHRVYEAARKMHFAAYPAHGSGFVMQLVAGDVSELRSAVESVEGLALVREQH